MYVSFGNFKRIIGEFIKNNRILFWEIQNRILGNVLGIIDSGLVAREHANFELPSTGYTP